MRKIVLCGALCAIIVLLAVPAVAQAQVAADAHRSRLVARQANARQRVAQRQAEIRAKVAAVMATNAMPVVVSTPIPTAKPTPAPTATPVVSAPQGTTGTAQDRIRAAWPGDDAKVLRVIACESGFNPRAVSSTGKFRSLFQFDRQTWYSVGGSGDPIDASVEEQVMRGWMLYQARGWAPWPHCGKR